MSSLTISETRISGCWSIQSNSFSDERGEFFRVFCSRELSPILANKRIEQINYSKTNNRGTVRGLHFQYPPFAEMKLIRCIRGRVWDITVDLRKSSPTFLQFHAEELVAEMKNMIIIPEGCAHGFQALEPQSELLYMHTEFYSPAHEGGLMYNDPRLTIDWPLPVTDISQKDRSYKLIDKDFKGIIA